MGDCHKRRVDDCAAHIADIASVPQQAPYRTPRTCCLTGPVPEPASNPGRSLPPAQPSAARLRRQGEMTTGILRSTPGLAINDELSTDQVILERIVQEVNIVL